MWDQRCPPNTKSNRSGWWKAISISVWWETSEYHSTDICQCWGTACPPMAIFKASRGKPEWRKYAPSGYAVCASKSRYISTKLFAEYGKKFVKFLRESNLMTPGIKHVVLLDLHKSHLFNSNYIEYMQANNIEVCSFPPHCTHILQPLDDLPYAMLKRKFQKELIPFNLQVVGEKLSKQQFF